MVGKGQVYIEPRFKHGLGKNRIRPARQKGNLPEQQLVFGETKNEPTARQELIKIF